MNNNSKISIISHRGYWLFKKEKNSLKAFKRSLSLGYGIEIDIRDYCGNLVVSHDIPTKNHLKLSTILNFYSKCDKQPVLAFNIKSNGLQNELRNQLENFKINNYFIFDASVPDAIDFINLGMITYTRQSEYETSPSFYDLANGIWMDEFNRNWINDDILKFHLKNGKKICIVSPELHGRDHRLIWKKLRKTLKENPKMEISICTDYPLDVVKYFK
tara:strand:- start:142 stop:789 length:648 start_codon:yes stop_codon:yes gene_type:complete